MLGLTDTRCRSACRGITALASGAALASGDMPICRESAQGAGSRSSIPVSSICCAYHIVSPAYRLFSVSDRSVTKPSTYEPRDHGVLLVDAPPGRPRCPGLAPRVGAKRRLPCLTAGEDQWRAPAVGSPGARCRVIETAAPGHSAPGGFGGDVAVSGRVVETSGSLRRAARGIIWRRLHGGGGLLPARGGGRISSR